MTLRTELENWEVEEIRDIKGCEFSVALKFATENYRHRKDVYIFPLASETKENEIWQVRNNEFVIFNNPELCHILISDNGIQTLFRTPAIRPGSIFGNNGKKFFLFEDSSYTTHIYSVSDRDELLNLVREIIDPAANVSIEDAPHSLIILVELHGLSHRFPLDLLLEDESNLECGLGADFIYKAQMRCREFKVAEYYEKCGGYYIGNSSVAVQGIFTENDGQYEFHPDDFFKNVAIEKLLAANNLVPGLPADACPFFRKGVDDEDYFIDLSNEVLIIEDKKNAKTCGLEMYGERCVGVMRTGENEFLALTEPPSTGRFVDSPTRLRRFVRNTAGKFLWDVDSCGLSSRAVVRPDRCQLDDDTIVFTTEQDYNVYSSFEMWSISKNRLAGPIDGFDAIKKATKEPYVSHTERQIMVRYRNHPQWKALPMIVVRIYAPREYCDIFALIDPRKKYRVYGKVYNMLADSMVEGPKTAHGLVKMFENNRELKLKYSL